MNAHREDVEAGQKGTREHLTRFGPSLLLVRSRYGEDRREHLKTVEHVVQRRPRERDADCPGSRSPGARAEGAASHRVAPRIGWQERDLQRRVKSAGGPWDPVRRVWMVRRDAAERLELPARVVGGGGGA